MFRQARQEVATVKTLAYDKSDEVRPLVEKSEVLAESVGHCLSEARVGKGSGPHEFGGHLKRPAEHSPIQLFLGVEEVGRSSSRNTRTGGDLGHRRALKAVLGK